MSSSDSSSDDEPLRYSPQFKTELYAAASGGDVPWIQRILSKKRKTPIGKGGDRQRDMTRT